MPVKSALRSAWPLFASVILMMAGNGLQGTYLGVRATLEAFDPVAIGFIMSMYFVGYLGGSRITPRLVRNVGHIRVFAALASLAGAIVLLQALIVAPLAWALLRAGTGFAFAGLYIVVESWLNDLSTRETRGRIMAFYLLTLYTGSFSGQLLLKTADPSHVTIFLVISILISLSLVPVALTPRPTPEFRSAAPLPISALWRASPLGVVAIASSGLGNSVLMSIGAVYTAERGFTPGEISSFMALLVLGGALFQIPIGQMSDRYERRQVMTFVAAASAGCAFLCMLFASSGFLLYLCAFLLGGFSMTIYGLCTAYMNDRLDPSQYVSASSSMILFNGAGAAIGPVLATTIMSVAGNNAFFPILALIYLAIALFALHRARVREAPAHEDKAPYIPMPSNTGALAPLQTAQLSGDKPD